MGVSRPEGGAAALLRDHQGSAGRMPATRRYCLLDGQFPPSAALPALPSPGSPQKRGTLLLPWTPDTPALVSPRAYAVSSFPRSSPKVAGVPGWTSGGQDGPVPGAAGGEALAREPSGPALVETVSWEGLQPMAGGSGSDRHRDASPASESLGQRVLGGAGGAILPTMKQPPRGSLRGHTVFFFIIII